jgi:hypothetical protein
MAITQVGSVLQYDIATDANAGTVSTAIEVPSDAELIVVGVSGFKEVNYFSSGAMTFTKGSADTAMVSCAGIADGSGSYFQAAMFYMVLPDTGTNKTLKWDWAGTNLVSNLPKISITFWKGIDTASPVRDSKGVQAGSPPFTPAQLTAQTGDLIIAFVGIYQGSEETTTAWSNLTLLSELTMNTGGASDGAWATGSPTGNVTVSCTSWTASNDGGMVATVFKSASGTLAITTPVQYRTFQRSGTTGSISITGTYTGSPTAIEASFNGGAYSTIDAAPSGGNYSGTLSSQAQGQGTLTVRFTNETTANASVTYIGIGDIFVIAGQSNACGQCVVNNVYYHPTLKATLFGNDYNWKELADETDSPTNQVDAVSQDTNPGGSAWVILATYIMQNQGVPVAFIPCALLGTTISQWQPGANHLDRTTLYGSMNYRIQQVGGAKAILWWQGESDAVAATSENDYNTALDTLANSIYSDRSVRLMPCKLMDLDSGVWMSNETPINNAIVTAWGDNSNVLTGPDFNILKCSENGDDVHYGNRWAYRVASKWYQALKTAFSWTDVCLQSALNFKAANSVTCAFPKNVTAGSLIVVCVSQYGGTIMNSSSISDGVNTYHLVGTVTSYTGDAQQRLAIYYAYNVAAGATTITFTGTSTPSISLAIHEYSGISTSDPLDKTAVGNTSDWVTTLDSGNTAETTQADELIFGVASPYNGSLDLVRQGSGFMLREEYPDGGSDMDLATADKTVNATGTYNITFIQAATGNGGICIVATFKKAAIGGGGWIFDIGMKL